MGFALGATGMLNGHSFGGAAQSGGSSPAADNMIDYVNPEFRAGAQQLLKMMGPSKPLSSATLPQAREMRSMFAPPTLPGPEVKEKLIPGPTGAPKVRVFIVGATPGAQKPAILHMHGGGYVIGSPAFEKRDLQDSAIALDCVVVSVDYRLAPDTPFPGSLEDNYAALRWLYSNAAELGVDPKRIATKGESAGGGHAAALAIAARDRGEFSLCHQVLIYPMLDDRTGSTLQVPPYVGHFVWTPEDNRFGWSSLLGVPAGSDRVPANAVPARVKNLEGLPPAFIGVGSVDLFASEDIEYARRLLEAGVSTELTVVPGGFHGFDGICSNVPLSMQFKNAWSQALRRAFKTA
jgi:acetyl esterase/lipase